MAMLFDNFGPLPFLHFLWPELYPSGYSHPHLSMHCCPSLVVSPAFWAIWIATKIWVYFWWLMATHLPCISCQRDSSLQFPKYNHTCLDIFLFLQFCFLVSSNKKKLFDTCARAGFQRYFRFTYLSYTSCSENSSLQGTHIYTCQYTFHHPLFWNLDPIVLNLQYDKRSFKMDVYLPCISFHQNSNPRYPLHSRICHGISPCMLFYYLRKCYANSETQNYNSSFFWGSSNMPYQFCISLHVNSSPQDIHNRICPRTFHYPL